MSGWPLIRLSDHKTSICASFGMLHNVLLSRDLNYITGGIAFDFWLTLYTSLVVFPVLDEALVEDGPCGSVESVSY